MVLNLGKKFALIALKTPSSIEEDLGFYLSGCELKVLSKFPFFFDDFWRKQLGEFRNNDFAEANVFLLIEKQSENVNLLDEENEYLKKTILRFYHSIYFVLPYIRILIPGILLSGSFINNNVDIRSVVNTKDPFKPSGSPFIKLDIDKIRSASELFTVQTFLWNKEQKGKYERFKKGYCAYIRAMNEFEADEKFHHFVRSIEALVFIDKGEPGAKTFSDRLCKIVNEEARFFEIIYELRNQVEHMNDLGAYLVREGYTSQDKKDSFLLDCMVKIMQIASFCYCVILKNKENLSFFESDAKIKEFWQKSDLIRTIWNEKLLFE